MKPFPNRPPSSKAFRCFRSSSAAEGAFRPLSNCKSSLSHTSVDILLFHFSCCAELVLHVEAEEDDVSVLYDVVFSLQAYQAFFSGCRQ